MSEHLFDRLARSHAAGLSRREVFKAGIFGLAGHYLTGGTLATAWGAVRPGKTGNTVLCTVARRAKPRCGVRTRSPDGAQSLSELRALAAKNHDWHSLTKAAADKGFTTSGPSNAIFIKRHGRVTLSTLAQSMNAPGGRTGLLTLLIHPEGGAKPLTVLATVTGRPSEPVEVLAPVAKSARQGGGPTAEGGDDCSACKVFCDTELGLVGALVIPLAVGGAIEAGAAIIGESVGTAAVAAGAGTKAVIDGIGAVVGAVAGAYQGAVGACESFCLGIGKCECPAPQFPCGGLLPSCVSPSNENCAFCGNECEFPKVCTAEAAGGTAVHYSCKCPNKCPAGSHQDPKTCHCSCNTGSDCIAAGVGNECCGDLCVNTQTDANNCGECGTSCASGLICRNGQCGFCQSSGECPDPTAEECCGKRCINVHSDDPLNCGGCGNECADTETCVKGICERVTSACGPGYKCPSGHSCCSHHAFETTGYASCYAGTHWSDCTCVYVGGNDPDNCGSCFRKCEPIVETNEAPNCFQGACEKCPPGWTYCNPPPHGHEECCPPDRLCTGLGCFPPTVSGIPAACPGCSFPCPGCPQIDPRYQTCVC